MENSFAAIGSLLDAHLTDIKQLLLELKHDRAGSNATDNTAAPIGRKVLNVDQLCEYAGLKKPTVYRLTSRREIPHGRRGKRLYFDRDAIDAWLLSNQRGTRADAEKKAEDYFLQRAARRAR